MQLTYKLRLAIAKIGLNFLRLSGFYKGYWQHWRGELFDYGERIGIHALPVHYYTPIPTHSDLSRKQRPNHMAGVDVDIQAGSARARGLLNKYKVAIDTFLKCSDDYDATNPGFHPLDAALLYATVSEARPKRIIEIGAGMSTFVITKALSDASLTETNFTCIEPFVPEYLKANGKNISEIIERPLQEVPLQRFKELEADDILFVDSTHVVRFDSDVVYEILDILPVLKSGVIVHIHDIFFPDDYPKTWLRSDRFFWNEQYMLQAFLSMNSNFRIEIPVHAIKNLLAPDELLQPKESKVEAVSLWMRRV